MLVFMTMCYKTVYMYIVTIVAVNLFQVNAHLNRGEKNTKGTKLYNPNTGRLTSR